MRPSLRARLRWRLLSSTGWLGHALARGQLRVRWLSWRWRSRRGRATAGEPARDFLWTPTWEKRYTGARGETSGDAGWCTEIYPGFRTDRPRITALDAGTVAAVGLQCRRTLPGAFVAQIPDGRIVSKRGDVISPDGIWLADVSVGNPRWVSRTNPFVNATIPPSLSELRGTALLLAHNWGENNYFHWLFNCLPRIQLYRQAGIDLAEVDHVVVSANPQAYRNETLAQTGVPLERLVECHEGFHARADRVLATSNAYYSFVFPWAHDFLRQTFLAADELTRDPERIFVRRDPARARRLVNEDQCLELFAEHGFVPVSLKGMTVADQAALFQGARCIASPHEAGLSNLVFCEPGAIVLELHPPTLLHAHYAELSTTRELEYYCLIGEDESGADPLDHAFRAPVDSLARLLELAGL
jgi:hypothetical protein